MNAVPSPNAPAILHPSAELARFASGLQYADIPEAVRRRCEDLLLDCLARAGVHATFFCIGRNARVYPYLISDMVEGGHEVANHTFHHVRLPGLARAAEARRAGEPS